MAANKKAQIYDWKINKETRLPDMPVRVTYPSVAICRDGSCSCWSQLHGCISSTPADCSEPVEADCPLLRRKQRR
jgi:hypothetical protein